MLKLRKKIFEKQEIKEHPLDDTWLVIRICKNPTKLWKKYIAKMYKDWELIASYPANQISEIDLKFFNP